MAGAKLTVRVQAEAFEPGAEIARLHGGDPAIGAITSFTGYCRDEGGRLAALELEHFPGMAEQALETIATEAAQRWPVEAITIIHRFGRLEPGDPIVLVVTASAHRRAAFQAAEFLMDYLKTDAPFWKKEHPHDPAEGARWVEAKSADDDDKKRWESV